MIERKIIKSKLNQFLVEEYISKVLDKPGYSHTEMKRTPLGEKITIFTSKPGLIVGRKGSAIKETADELKNKFGLENPQIEVSEIENLNLNPNAVAKRIVHTFERFGPKRYKILGYQVLQDIINAGATGAEIVISGRGVPSQRSKTWRFKAGHLKKSGDISANHTKRAHAVARLKSGAVGVEVVILTPDVILPDSIKHLHDKSLEKVKEMKIEVTEEVLEETPEVKEEIQEDKKEKKSAKKTTKKTTKKTNEVKETLENGDNKEE